MLTESNWSYTERDDSGLTCDEYHAKATECLQRQAGILESGLMLGDGFDMLGYMAAEYEKGAMAIRDKIMLSYPEWFK